MCPESEVRYAVQIHWFSIINSCVTVLLLTGFLATILMRVLKNDFIKYTRDDDGAPLPPSSSAGDFKSCTSHWHECVGACMQGELSIASELHCSLHVTLR